MTQTRTFTKEEFERAVMSTSVASTWKFWQDLMRDHECPNDLRDYAEDRLKVLITMLYHRLDGVPNTPQTQEIFAWCGLPLPN